MNDDLKDFQAYAPPIWPQVLFGAILLGCFLVASFIQNNAERQVSPKTHLEGRGAKYPPSAVSAPYIPCAKTQQGKQLHSEIAHWRKDGWVIHCDYRGLMTRDEVQL